MLAHGPTRPSNPFQIDGLSGLQALEELWLCRNGLTEIGDNLPLGPALSEINLAHNRLGYFKELLKLAPLAGLRSLTLQDPHFGDNPVCSLSNYRTYVAYHLTQVKAFIWTAYKKSWELTMMTGELNTLGGRSVSGRKFRLINAVSVHPLVRYKISSDRQ